MRKRTLKESFALPFPRGFLSETKKTFWGYYVDGGTEMINLDGTTPIITPIVTNGYAVNGPVSDHEGVLLLSAIVTNTEKSQ